MYNKHQKSIIFVAIIAFIYIFPLLNIGIYYIDDMSRILHGEGWDHDGRNFATVLMQFLTAGGKLITNIAPYSQLITTLILAISGYFISHMLKLEKGYTYKFSPLILLISPYFLENLSYSWDSIPMAISIFLVIIPFLFLSKSKYIFSLISFIGLTLSLLTYQASFVVYPTICILLSIDWALDNKKLRDIITLWLHCFINSILALLAYKLITVLLGVHLKNRSTSIFSETDIISHIKQNINGLCELVSIEISSFFTLSIFIILSFSIIYIITHLIKSKNTRVNKCIICILPFVAIFFISILFIILKDPWVTPRMLVGYSLFIYLPLIFINRISVKLLRVSSFCFILISFPLIAAYANALKAQDSHEVFIAQRIAQTADLNNKEFAFKGKLRFSTETNVAMNKYPILKKLVPSYMNNDWMWGEKKFLKANDYIITPKFAKKEAYNQLINAKDSLPVLDETIFYILRGDSTRIVVDFDTPDSRRFECPFY